jgi:hypothetical protein
VDGRYEGEKAAPAIEACLILHFSFFAVVLRVFVFAAKKFQEMPSFLFSGTVGCGLIRWM